LFSLPIDVDLHLQHGGTLLVPSRQRAHAVRLAHAAAQLAAGVRVWSSPDVITPSGWARRECERAAQVAPGAWPRILSSAEEWLLWREAAAEVARDLPFLDAGALAESLQRSSEHAAQYGVRLGDSVPGSEAQLLKEAQDLLDARCRALRAATVSALTPKLAERRAAPPLLRGFDTVPPALAALGTIRASPAADRLVPVSTPPRVVRTADLQSQTEAIAAWCVERLRRQPDARLLVMLPGPPGARERLAALIRGALDPLAQLSGAQTRVLVGIEGGEPFGALALPAQALAALTFLSGIEIDVERLSRWLTAPFWGSPAAVARAALAQMLRQRRLAAVSLRTLLGALQLAPAELRSAARELDAQLVRAAGVLSDSPASPRRWSERFESALAELSWPGTLAADSGLQQTRLRWRELLEEFGDLEAISGTLRRSAALELLRALAMRTRYRPADEDVPVTLSAVLADPVVRYDGVWVGSLSADVLPQPIAPDPFLPLAAQLAAGMPEANGAGRRAQANTLLAAFRAATPELVLSVPARDEDQLLLPSPYLSALTIEDTEPRTLWLPQRLHRDGQLEQLADDSGTTFNPRRPLPGGTRALTLQNACAFRAYAELRLGAAAPEQAEPGVPMDQRGLLLHAALQMLWERLRDSQRLEALDEHALGTLIADCVSQAAQGLQGEVRPRRRGYRPPDGQFDLFSVLSPALERECARARTLIRRLCELERSRAPFTVQATEHVMELAAGGGRLRMRLDRIDSVPAGRAVLDYKSGRAGSPDWYGERPSHPQLLAYLAALGRDVVALATVNLTAQEVRFSGVAAAAGVLPRVKALPPSLGDPAADWDAQQRRWQELIERLIRAFLAGDARVDPAPGACDYCHITDICRIGAHLAPESAAHADDADE
jgi:ATP-dependent helicase/nuclease subunit B